MLDKWVLLNKQGKTFDPEVSSVCLTTPNLPLPGTQMVRHGTSSHL